MPDKISLQDFQKLDLRVAEIIEAEEIPGKDKLLKLTIDLGEEKRILVAGIKQYYSIESLINKKIIIIANLETAILGGIESNGMLLAASNKNKSEVVLLSPEQDIENGSKIY